MVHVKMLLFASSLIGLGLVASASAFPLNYNESVDGDLVQDANGRYRVLTLDRGENTVSGLFGTAVPNGPSDFDAFRFIVPEGLLMTTLTLTLADYTQDLDDTRFVLSASGPIPSQDIFITSRLVKSPGVGTFPALDAGSYAMTQQFYGYRNNNYGLCAYTFAFTVVPEPASLSLVALSALALRRRPRSVNVK